MGAYEDTQNAQRIYQRTSYAMSYVSRYLGLTEGKSRWEVAKGYHRQTFFLLSQADRQGGGRARLHSN